MGSTKGRMTKWGLIILIVLTGIGGIFSRGLWTPDEPRVTAICAEMAASGDFVIPMLAGQPFLEKPPLGFVVGSEFIRAFRGHLSPVVSVRLASVFWGWLVLLFSYALVRRLHAGSEIAWKTILILGSSWAFVENQHWIRVDAALAFFVLAAVWAFAGAFVENRPWWAALGGVFAGGAFLTKGIVGLVLIFPAWLGLLYAWPQWRQKWKFHVAAHLLGGGILSALSGFWIYLLWIRGGAVLFGQWFWLNQVGRATGTTVILGHIHVGEPWYYLGYLIAMMLPWSPFLLVWLVTKGKSIWRKEALDAVSRFALTWGLGSIFVLSLPATKRGVYLLPVLPVFALISALGWEEIHQKWKGIALKIWVPLAGMVCLILLISPLWAARLTNSMRPEALSLLLHWDRLHVLAALVLVLMLLAFFGKWDVFSRFAGVSALLFFLLWVFPARVIDRQKSLRVSIDDFVKQVPPEVWPEVRGWQLSETMRAFLYLYEELEVSNCSGIRQAEKVLSGNDPHHHYLLFSSRAKAPLPPSLGWVVVAEGVPGKRRLSLVKGKRASFPVFQESRTLRRLDPVE